MSGNESTPSQKFIKKDLHWSIDAINKFKEEAAYHVESETPLLKGAKAYIKYSDGRFIIKVILENRPLPKELDDTDSLIPGKKLIFRKWETLYEAKGDHINSITQTLSDPHLLEYDAKSFSIIGKENKALRRLIIPTINEPSIEPFQRYSMEIDSVVYFGLFKSQLRGVNYECYKYENEDLNRHYLIIESKNEVSSEIFKEDTQAILLGIGVLTGNLYRGEHFTLAYMNEEETWKYDSLIFENIEDSVVTNVAIVSPHNFSDYVKHTKQEKVLDKIDLFVTEETFSRMCLHIIGNEKIQRIITLILEGNSTNTFVLKSAIYSVALETLSNVIYTEHRDKLDPITDPKLSEKIIAKIHAVISDYSAFLTIEQVQILTKKANSFNKPNNIDKLVKSFQLLRLNLTKHDIETLKHRNVFLHGSSPVKDFDKDFDKKVDLVLISRKLHFLVTCLLVRYLGYRGHVANLYVFTESKTKKTASEPFFRVLF